jgi:ubiquinone/menaquinone biosynthesis C-methylase UbiE
VSESVSFDRAADYYDRTRAVPDELMARIVPMLMAELPHEGITLEVGIGTGRIALPLIHQGVRLVGVDISREMLRRMVVNGGESQPTVAQADATRLPFCDRTFAAALAVHVLHLIPAWRVAVAELLRVVAPGGVVIVSRGTRGRIRAQGVQPADDWDLRLTRRFFGEAGDPPWPPGLDSLTDLDDFMRDKSAEQYEIPELRIERTSSVNELLANLEAGYWAACWGLDEATRRRAAGRTREWAGQEIGDPDAPRSVTEGSVWHVYRLPE